MARRLKVLISAYACEPNRGSEPEVGWQWALQMARFHDVTVLTRANNRVAIEAGLASLRGRQPLPDFAYHDRHALLMRLKRRLGATQLYYLLWQRSAWGVIDRLHQVMRPKGILFGFFHTRDAGPEAPYYRFNIAAADSIELRPGPPFRLQRIFNNRHVENLFHDYASVKFFLGRDNMREVLVIR